MGEGLCSKDHSTTKIKCKKFFRTNVVIFMSVVTTHMLHLQEPTTSGHPHSPSLFLTAAQPRPFATPPSRLHCTMYSYPFQVPYLPSSPIAQRHCGWSRPMRARHCFACCAQKPASTPRTATRWHTCTNITVCPSLLLSICAHTGITSATVHTHTLHTIVYTDTIHIAQYTYIQVYTHPCIHR